MSITEIISISISSAAVGISIILPICFHLFNKKKTKAECIEYMTKNLRGDKEMHSFFLKNIDYHVDKNDKPKWTINNSNIENDDYGKLKRKGTQFECNLDYFITLLSNWCYLKRKRFISNKDFQLFGYEMHLPLLSLDFVSYLSRVIKMCDESDWPTERMIHPFYEFMNYIGQHALESHVKKLEKYVKNRSSDNVEHHKQLIGCLKYLKETWKEFKQKHSRVCKE